MPCGLKSTSIAIAFVHEPVGLTDTLWYLPPVLTLALPSDVVDTVAPKIIESSNSLRLATAISALPLSICGLIKLITELYPSSKSVVTNSELYVEPVNVDIFVSVAPANKNLPPTYFFHQLH